MASSNEYTDEQLNYYRICYLTTNILAEGLRELFKQEWDKRYKSTLLGEWEDKPRNGMDFYNCESPRNQGRNAHILATVKNGNRGDWDCKILFYAILFSYCVGPTLSAKVRKNVDDLRQFRIKFAHMRQGSLSEIDFQNAISKVEVAFQALSLSTVKIQDLKYQKTFQTKDLTKVRKEVDDLKQEVQQLRKLIGFNDSLVADHHIEVPGGSSFLHENMGCFNSLLCSLCFAYLLRSPSFSYVKYFLFTVYILVPSK